MLKAPQEIFHKIKNRLLKKQRELEKNLKKIEAADPATSDALAESSETGTDSWIAEVHGKTVALRQSLMALLQNTKQALANLRQGHYGKCQKCGQAIELERLEAIPTATVCLSCSRKK